MNTKDTEMVLTAKLHETALASSTEFRGFRNLDFMQAPTDTASLSFRDPNPILGFLNRRSGFTSFPLLKQGQ